MANAATVALAGNGTICFTSSVPTHLIVDVVGWLGDTGGLRVAAQTPQRLVDTRIGLGGVVGPVVKNGNVAVPSAGNGHAGHGHRREPVGRRLPDRLSRAAPGRPRAT